MKQTRLRWSPAASLRAMFVAVLAAVLCVAPTASVAAAPPANGILAGTYADAAKEFNVPNELLLAVSYNLTRWEIYPGMSIDGGWGPMNLRTQVSATDHDHGHGDERHQPTGEGRTTGTFTLDQASQLLGVSPDALKNHPRQNIRGAAAVLSDEAKKLNNGKTPKALTDWYAAVAKFSGSDNTRTADMFADDVFSSLKNGVRATTTSGQHITLSATPALGSPDRAKVRLLGLRDTGLSSNHPGGAECPRQLDCRFIPAAYGQNADATSKTDYGNYDPSNRPKDMKIKYIVIHDTEGSYTGAISHFQNLKTYVSAHYVIRSSDGAITQMVATKDTAWHAGDWWVNMHSIGIEHEGVAATGAAWYTEAMYRSSAELVRYLAKKYDIPLDRDHIIGHDNVPGLNDKKAAAMHYDPGPYWDWNHYMDLIQGKKPGTTEKQRSIKGGNIVTINPKFSQNLQMVKVCDKAGQNCVEQTEPSNFVYLRAAPRTDAPLITDILLQPDGSPGTNRINDWTAKAASGQQYALAGTQGDWTAIWHNGQEAWLYNPANAPTATIGRGKTLQLKPGKDNVNVYGGAYPEKSAYPADMANAPIQPKLAYTIKAGQSYVSNGVVPTDYFYDWTVDSSAPYDHMIFRGNDRFIQIWYNQRTMFVRADDVILQ